MAGRKDILDKVRPSLKTQMRLWWDLVSEDGYGYNWGRSQGLVSYLDTPEIAGFLAITQSFDLHRAKRRSLRFTTRRGTISIMTTVTTRTCFRFLLLAAATTHTLLVNESGSRRPGSSGKLANSHVRVIEALHKEGIASFPAQPTLTDVNRFEFFRKAPDREAGVWLVRQGSFRFALPITTGPKPGLSDYLPVPHGLPGFAAPVEQVYPVLVPFIELADGRTVIRD